MKSVIFAVTNDLNYDQRMQRICGSLFKEGYDVTLVGRKRNNSKSLPAQPFRQKRLHCLFEKGKLFYIEYNLRLFFWLLFRKADCYSAVDLDTILPCLFVAKLNGKKLVYDAHEYFTEVPEVVNRPFIKKIWEWIEKFSLKRIDTAYTVSQGIADLFLMKYSVRFEVIRNLPNKNFVTFDSPEEEYILYQGALNVGRAIEHYILAMHYVDCRLYLAGEGDLSEHLRRLVKREKLEHKVRFLGLVAPYELKIITARAKIGLNCAENLGLSYYYSLSNKLFDYIMAGIPQIISDLPEFRRVNDEYQIAVQVQDIHPEILSVAINRLRSDSSLYAELRNNCINAREILNWENEEGKLLQMYRSI